MSQGTWLEDVKDSRVDSGGMQKAINASGCTVKHSSCGHAHICTHKHTCMCAFLNQSPRQQAEALTGGPHLSKTTAAPQQQQQGLVWRAQLRLCWGPVRAIASPWSMRRECNLRYPHGV
eukprot:269300-Pelagomonas_calceolata.AAC.13